MAHLHPSLLDKFRSEGLCPICLIEMAYSPRFTCDSGHVICHRCRPYYYSCPQCLQPLHEVASSSPGPAAQLVQNVPYPPYPHLAQPYPPSAPDLTQFHHHEQQHSNWQPPRSPPREDQELLQCPYAHLGCTARFVPALRDMHVSRCQYKYHSNEGVPCNEVEDPDERFPCRYKSAGCNVQAPRDCLRSHEEICIYKDRQCGDSPTPCQEAEDPERIPCRYQSAGCNVRAARWRLREHESLCIYKDRDSCSSSVKELGDQLQGSCHLEDGGDLNRMVECRYRHRGCMVRVPLWRKQTHEAKCNYGQGECQAQWHSPEVMADPEAQVDCRWAEYGCRVRPKYYRKEIHEEKCNYRMEECSYRHRGCHERLHPSRRYAHEQSCSFAY